MNITDKKPSANMRNTDPGNQGGKGHVLLAVIFITTFNVGCTVVT